MSASDAAPLPRLGEVFFDVRGNSRSMRLSWYADTGVAVLSIWQGGMCTGTFRLAIADLPRMVETLQRGPGGQRPEWDSETPGQAFADAPDAAVHTMGPLSGQMQTDFQAEPPDQRAGSGQYPAESLDQRAGPGQYPAESLDQRAGPGQYQGGHRTGQPDYLGAPPDRRAAAAEYLPAPPDDRTAAPDYRADPLGTPRVPSPPGLPGLPDDPRARSAPYQTGAREYLPEPPDRSDAPPDRRAGAAEYLSGPPDYPAPPPEHRTEYLADLPAPAAADPAGYGGNFGADSTSGGSYPAPGGSGASPRGGGHQGGYPGESAGDPYLAGTRPVDYQAEPSVPHYKPGSSSAPSMATRGDALGPPGADYPAHYSTAVTDDLEDEPPADSFLYRRPDSR